MNWSEFFDMGGYALYVWPSWGLTLSVLVWHFIQAKMMRSRIIQEIARQQSREQKLNQT